MGSLLGHVVPGTFFIVFSIWWGFCLAKKCYQIQKSRKKIIFYSTTTFSCLCYSSSNRNISMESFIKLFCVGCGIVGEFVTGFTYLYNETLKKQTWHLGENNTQHITMFLAFGLASIIEIFVHIKYSLPDGIEYLANIIAFCIEAILFHFHLHGRNEIDIHVHTLLVYAIIFCIIAAIWEYNRPNQILATYARTIGTFLQGVWFYAIGFILYFPSTDPYWIWLPNHEHILLITVIFIWCAFSICIFLFLQIIFVWYILNHRQYTDNEYAINNEYIN